MFEDKIIQFGVYKIVLFVLIFPVIRWPRDNVNSTRVNLDIISKSADIYIFRKLETLSSEFFFG